MLIDGAPGVQGYWAFGNQVQQNVLFSLKHPASVIALASMMGVLGSHICGWYTEPDGSVYACINVHQSGVAQGVQTPLVLV